MVERPPPRGIIDEFGIELDTSASEIASPPVEEPQRPPPRPYISRIRSSNGSMGEVQSPISPTNSMPVPKSPASPTSPVLRSSPRTLSASPVLEV